MLRRFAVQNRFQGGIGAHPVIVAVSADHTAVKADIRRTEGGNKGDLCGDQVAFHNTVLLMEQLHHVQLVKLLTLGVLQRQAADENVQVFSGKGLRQLLAHLIPSQVGQDIGDGKLGVFRPVADIHGDLCAVLPHDLSVHGQGDRRPLVMLDPAVIVGLQQRQLICLVQRNGL